MAVSLVSTGVQFPDSTIQTTAATAGAAAGWVKIQGQQFSAVSTVDFTTGINSTYKSYMFVFTNVSSSTTSNANLNAQFSSNGGSTWTGVANFVWYVMIPDVNNNAFTTYSQYQGNFSGGIRLVDSWFSDTVTSLSGTFLLSDPASTSRYKQGTGYFNARTPTGIASPIMSTGYWSTTTAANAVRFTGSGTLTGNITLYGLT